MNVARFEKVSPEQFAKDMQDNGYFDFDLSAVSLPSRATSGSAGYDFYSPVEVNLEPGESCRIPTGIRCFMENDYVLQIYPRSSFGFRYQMALLNTVGIIDSDYYGADNEGHIIIGIVNRGNKTMKIGKGDRFVQGIFMRYYLAEEEENNSSRRHGGFGSTD